jgi:hypothetical protein
MAMNISRVLLAGTAILSTSLLSPLALASPAPTAHNKHVTYQGGGYTVSIGSQGSYYGCDPQKQCLGISKYSYQNQGQFIWENKNISYSMTPMLLSKQGRYRLKIFGPKNELLASQIMRPVKLDGISSIDRAKTPPQ